MEFLWASLVVAGFALVLERLDLPSRAVEVGRRSRSCLEVLRDPALTDERKEAALQGHALRLFVLLGILVGGSALALAAPLGVVWCLHQMGWASFPAVWSTLQRLDFLAVVTVAGGVVWLVARWWSS